MRTELPGKWSSEFASRSKHPSQSLRNRLLLHVDLLRQERKVFIFPKFFSARNRLLT
jgi:hypothetical protein